MYILLVQSVRHPATSSKGYIYPEWRAVMYCGGERGQMLPYKGTPHLSAVHARAHAGRPHHHVHKEWYYLPVVAVLHFISHCRRSIAG